MNISVKAKRNIFILWLLVVPLGSILVYQYAPSRHVEWDAYLILLLLMLLTSSFPFFISGNTMFLSQWVSLAAFLNYGIFAEMILMQLSILPIAYHIKVNKDNFYRIAFSSLMFFIISVVCGVVVHLLGYNLGSLEVKDLLLFGTIYALCDVILNHALIYLRDSSTGNSPKLVDQSTIWDVIGLTITLPFGISLYFLESYIGTIAFVLLGLPFLMITLLVRLYSNSEKVNADLNEASQFGHELAERMTGKEIIDMFMERITKMFPIDSAYIVDDLYGKFQILRAREDGENVELFFAPEDLDNSLAGVIYKKGIPTLFDKQSEWINMKPPFLASDMQSVMCVPIYRNQKIESILVLASRKKYAFEAYQLKMVHLLCSYFAVSVEKAKYVRNALARSERCELTNLYNYRYLDKRLEFFMEKLSLGEYKTVSLIMMDIDHFKSVNDTYGHHSGNIILKEFARVIKDEIGSNGTVARYGGEEFVILLPNYTKVEATNIAERLRRKIEQTPFMVELDLDEVSQEEIIFITASIGVSTAPEDSDEGMSLLRNADRALYIGAKQAGRNRVAEYVR
ncbi:sensor domain-containing diguanylate cyclase [Psychrobacillus sp. FJAT-51614]|uniref:Sensor domain-containing diguanylate cyclase n=1 Tax=Psychrobacillus mangrovi TaxID=3117745 RepID=A0ABU8F313_9BACI